MGTDATSSQNTKAWHTLGTAQAIDAVLGSLKVTAAHGGGGHLKKQPPKGL